MDQNLTIRNAAIQHCRLLSLQWGDAVPASELSRAFLVGEERILLVAWGRGIFKPKQLTDGPLTLISSMASSYADERLEGDVLLYDYAPSHSDEWANEGLKRIARSGRPVILLEQVKPKPNPEYMVFAPVSILGFDDAARKFRLSLADAQVEVAGIPAPMPKPFSKAYAKTTVMARLHQAHFRNATLAAYAERCAVCEMRERPLLDAAHIIPDRLPDGVAEVRNGLAMCPTHHRAYDQNILLVTEQYQVEVRRDRLRHPDSPQTARMLLDFDKRKIWLPQEEHLRPAPEFLRRKIELVA